MSRCQTPFGSQTPDGDAGTEQRPGLLLMSRCQTPFGSQTPDAAPEPNNVPGYCRCPGVRHPSGVRHLTKNRTTAWGDQLKSNKLVASSSSTASSCWLITTHAHEIIPRSARGVERRTPCTRARNRSVSPGRTGTRQPTCPSPGEPKDSESCSAASTASRIASAQVCQPLAINPPQRPCFARSTSVWNHCGSYWRANVRISASVTTTGPP